MTELKEAQITIVGRETRLEGTLVFDLVVRVHGTLVGQIQARPGSTLILAETAVVDGTIEADELIVEGFVKGNIRATGKVTVAPNGRVLGNILSPSVSIAFGARFEGKCEMHPTTSPA